MSPTIPKITPDVSLAQAKASSRRAVIASAVKALACDYDGTLAHDGAMSDSTAHALARFAQSRGAKLFLVTGRELPELQEICPFLPQFDYVVAENGALLYHPSTGEKRLLCAPPDQRFVLRLKSRNVTLSVGDAIVATWSQFEDIVVELIRELALELQIIRNKGAVMILPTGVNKATGLKAILSEITIDPSEVVAFGDAENDHALLSTCGVGVAVANALPALKQRADYIAAKDHGDGVEEVIDILLSLGDGEFPQRI